MKTVRSLDEVDRDIKRVLERTVNAIIDEALKLAKSLTPVRTGRAKRGFKRRDNYRAGSSRTTVIENQVPYIGVLDGAVPARGGGTRGPIMKPALDRALYITRRIK